MTASEEKVLASAAKTAIAAAARNLDTEPPTGSGARPVVRLPPPPSIPDDIKPSDFQAPTRLVLSESSPMIRLDSGDIQEGEPLGESPVKNPSTPPPPRVSDRPPAPLPAICDFGRFELLGRIAFGGMAEIFLAREPLAAGTSRHVVIKRILPHVADNMQFARMFVDEARLAMQLNHPNICHIYEFGQEEGHLFICMEWLNGVSLGKLIRRARHSGGVPANVSVKIIAEIAGALHYAHRARDTNGQLLELVHRDVSPQNVMVTYDGIVKLLDFGIAKASSQITKTQAGTIKGKFAYMAPEQCLGQPLDRRADIFSLGICLYESLTGRPLYHRKIEYETMQAVVHGDVPSIRDIDPDLPEELDGIVQRCLQKNPAERFQTAGELQTALEQWLITHNHAVTSGRIGDLMNICFDEEIQRGPLVDSTPFGRSLNPLRDSERVAKEALASAAHELDPDTKPDAAALRRPRRGLAAMVAGLVAVGAMVGGALVFQREGSSVSPARNALPPAEVPEPARAIPAPPDEIVPATVGTLSLESTPAGARVFINGEPMVDPTPTEITDLAGGEVTVRLEHPGYQHHRTMATVVPGETTELRVDLQRARRRARAQLSLNTRPWSKVYIGRRLLGTTPIETAVPSGTVRLRLVDRDGNEHHRSVRVTADENRNAFFDLSE